MSSPGLKRQPSLIYTGKENDQLAFHSPNATSNPYLNSHNPNDGDYNPLYIQPRDNASFRIFPYDDDEKSQTTTFQPINGHGSYSSLHLPPHLATSYDSGQHNGETFDI